MNFNLTPETVAERIRLHGSTVSVVEDDPALARLYRILLGNLYRIGAIGAFDVFQSAEDCLHHVSDWIAGTQMIVISDLELPGLNGIQMAEMMREVPDIRLIIATNVGDLKRVQRQWEDSFPGTKGDDYVIHKLGCDVVGKNLLHTIALARPLVAIATAGG